MSKSLQNFQSNIHYVCSRSSVHSRSWGLDLDFLNLLVSMLVCNVDDHIQSGHVTRPSTYATRVKWNEFISFEWFWFHINLANTNCQVYTTNYIYTFLLDYLNNEFVH